MKSERHQMAKVIKDAGIVAQTERIARERVNRDAIFKCGHNSDRGNFCLCSPAWRLPAETAKAPNPPRRRKRAQKRTGGGPRTIFLQWKKLTCRTGPNDEQGTAERVIVVKGRPMEGCFFYSALGTRCARSTGRRRPTLTPNGLTMQGRSAGKVTRGQGPELKIRSGPFEAQVLGLSAACAFCGMYGQLNGVVEVFSKKFRMHSSKTYI